jgi:hypothetical protein
VAKRRNLKKEKAARNQAYARQFRKTTSRFGKNTRGFGRNKQQNAESNGNEDE